MAASDVTGTLPHRVPGTTLDLGVRAGLAINGLLGSREVLEQHYDIVTTVTDSGYVADHTIDPW